jgi:Fanconi anemia group M protein
MPQIINFTPRLYQETIFSASAKQNTLVVLPTGMGKTAIAMMLIAHRLQQYPQSKCLIVAPTKPLVDQHAATLKTHLVDLQNKIVVFTGTIAPEKRAELWKDAQIIVSTPQGLENDIISNKIDITSISAFVIDEAHRAVGDYSYVWLAQQYNQRARYPRILALTASPGSEIEHIQEIVTNLCIEHIEVRTETDPDVAPYIQDIALHWEYVTLPDYFVAIQQLLKACFQSKIEEIKKKITLEFPLSESKADVLRLQAHLQGEIASGNKDFDILKALSLAAEAMKVQHALELVETQGLHPLIIYFEEILKQARTSKVKAVQNLAADVNFKNAYIKTKILAEKNIEHPKIQKLRDILNERFDNAKKKEYNDYKMIVFTQYRDTGMQLVDVINMLPAMKAKLFVGQAKKRGSGLSQKEQLAILNEFKESQFNVLVSSSVGEEGLDIPQVDAVIFFEPIPSAIRHIQRRGRTGRHDEGEVIILVTKGTRDEGYKWSAHHKEKRMYRNLEQLKKTITFTQKKEEKKEVSLQQYVNEKKITIFADYREKGNHVIKELLNLHSAVDLQQLEVGDYLLSSRCAVEYKAVPDFVNSLIDGRLLQQAKELKKQYSRPLYIIEGIEDIYAIRNIHPNAIRGMLAALTVDFGIPVLQTKTAKETAALLATIAKREQEFEERGFSLHGDRKPINIKDQQEYIITAFPSLGQSVAKPLLKEFKSIKNFVNATEEELKKVPLIGEKKARQIRDIIDTEWKEFD